METIISIAILLTAFPLGLFLKQLTKDYEEHLYESIQYFPSFLWIIAIAAAIFYTISITIALTLSYMFLLILTWSR